MLGLFFSIHDCFSFEKLFQLLNILPSLALTSKNILIIFKKFNQSMINEKLSVLEFAKLSPS